MISKSLYNCYLSFNLVVTDTCIFLSEPYQKVELTEEQKLFIKTNNLGHLKVYSLYHWKTFHFFIYLNYFLVKKAFSPQLAQNFKSFMFLNGQVALNRCIVIDELARTKALTSNLYSWQTNNIGDSVLDDYSFKFFDGNKKYLDHPSSIHPGYANITPQLFSKALWQVAIERESYMEGLISEKVIIPIFFKRPFLYLSSPNSIHFLKKLGFDVFDDYIDISYDKEYDLEKRCKMFANEVKKITLLENKKILPIIKQKCHKNLNNMISLVYNEKLDIDKEKILDMYFKLQKIPNKLKELKYVE